MTKEEKRKQTIINRYGSWEAYIETLRTAGSRGGKLRKTPTGFALSKEHAKQAGKKGSAVRWGHGKTL